MHAFDHAESTRDTVRMPWGTQMAMLLLVLRASTFADPLAPRLAPRHQLTNATGRSSAPLPFSVGDDGGIQVQIDALTASVSSSFTSQSELCAFGRTPYGAQGGWFRPLTVDRSTPGRVRVLGVTRTFSVERLIVGAEGRLLINDTIKVLRTDSPGNATAVQQSHSATFGSSGIKYTSVDGPNNEYPEECTSESAGMYGNPSIFVAAQQENSSSSDHVGVGLLALDDVFGLHARAINAAVNTGFSSKCEQTSPPSVSLQDMQFGLQGPDEHTAEWAIHTTGKDCTTSDPFWCFSNAVRQDMGVNSLPINGNGILNALRWGNRLAPLGYTNGKEWRQWSTEKMGEFLDTNAYDWVASDIPYVCHCCRGPVSNPEL